MVGKENGGMGDDSAASGKVLNRHAVHGTNLRQFSCSRLSVTPSTYLDPRARVELPTGAAKADRYPAERRLG